MGVRGLQFYLEQCCHTASPVVNIEELAKSYRESENNENQLVIIVDGLNCIQTIYGDLEWVGGGQLKQYGEKAQNFVQAFSDIGIRLVFFFDGPTQEDKRRTWIERRLMSMEKYYKLFDALNQGKPSRDISRELFSLPPGLGQLSRLIFQVLCGCEVIQSVNDCDEEIVQYARDHNVFAILAQDTDYVIFDTGRTLYLSMKHLDLNSMTTRLYSSRELANYLRIHPSQLPLLATLMGNDIVTSDDLKSFHTKIVVQHYFNRRKDYRVLVPYLARYIQRLPFDRNQLCNMLQDISMQMFGTPDKAGDILKSLNSYNIYHSGGAKREDNVKNNSWAELVDIAKRGHQSNQIPTIIYAVMDGLPFESSTSLEDFRLNDLPFNAIALKPLRQRLYGVLLQEKPLLDQRPHEVPEYCMAGPGSLDGPSYVSAIPPERPHPGLRELWFGQPGPVRWQLFISCVSPSLDPDRVRLLPPYLVIPVLILYYYSGFNCFAPWEVDAMLATATSLKLYDTARLAALPADPLSVRSVRVANLIMRSTFTLYNLMAACGYPLNFLETAPWNYFDGKLFQTKYREAKQGFSHSQLCEHRVDVLEEFQMSRSILN